VISNDNLLHIQETIKAVSSGQWIYDPETCRICACCVVNDENDKPIGSATIPIVDMCINESTLEGDQLHKDAKFIVLAHNVVPELLDTISYLKTELERQSQYIQEKGLTKYELGAWNSLRPEVQAFALAMEERLKANDHKGGWKNESPDWLIRRMRQEFSELEMAIDYQKNIRHESADVANFAMMIADVCGALE